MSDIHELEVSLAKVKEDIRTVELLEKLEKNAAFKELILKRYFEERAQNLVYMKAGAPDDRQKEIIENGMQGIANLRSWFSAITVNGAAARDALEAHQAEINLVKGEE